jgi:hypothetical protein
VDTAEIELETGEVFQCLGKDPNPLIYQELSTKFDKVCVKFINTEIIDGAFRRFLKGSGNNKLCTNFISKEPKYGVNAPFGWGDWRPDPDEREEETGESVGSYWDD